MTMSTHYPKVNYKNRFKASIDDYFFDVAWTWNRDSDERTVFDLWLHVVDHCTRLVEAVRKERPREVINDLADTVMWFLSFLAQTHYSRNPVDTPFKITSLPSDIIWNKYPAICPACFEFDIIDTLGTPPADKASAVMTEKRGSLQEAIIKRAKEPSEPTICQCLSRIVFTEDGHDRFNSIANEIDELRLLYAQETRNLDKKITVVRQLEEMFEKIFGNAYQVFSIETIAFHLLEEVGEVSRALKDCYTFDSDREPFTPEVQVIRIRKFEEEIADVFSWIYALMLKIRFVYYDDAQKYFQTLVPEESRVRVVLDFTGAIHLSDIIWSKYGRKKDGLRSESLLCSGCFSAPCRCRRNLKLNWT